MFLLFFAKIDTDLKKVKIFLRLIGRDVRTGPTIRTTDRVKVIGPGIPAF